MKGSIFKRGKNYTVAIYRGKKAHPTIPGKVIKDYKHITVGPKKKDADAMLAKYVHDEHQGVLIEPSKLTVAEWLDQWFTNVSASGKLTPGTLDNYLTVVNHVKAAPEGKLPLQKLKAFHLETYAARLQTTRAPSTVRGMMRTISLALTKARRSQLVPINAADDMDLPRVSTNRGTEAKANCWTEQEAQHVIIAADAMGSLWSSFFALGLDSGARLRELAGLRWTNLHLDKRMVDIVEQLSNKRRKRATPLPMWVATKTGRTRRLTLDPRTVARLRLWKRHQAEARLASGKPYSDHDLVFAQPDGTPIAANRINERELAAVIAAAGVKKIRFHGLRHTSATLALLGGVNPLEVAKRLGHARASITLDVYGHILDEVAARPLPIGKALYGTDG